MVERLHLRLTGVTHYISVMPAFRNQSPFSCQLVFEYFRLTFLPGLLYICLFEHLFLPSLKLCP